MMDLINQKTLTQLDETAAAFACNSPFKHVVIDDFFETHFCQELLENFPAFDKRKALNENGEVGRKAVHEHIDDLGTPYQKLHNLIKNQSFISLIENITGIKGLIFDPFYFGGGTHNNLHGQDLDPHVDFTNHPKTGLYRRLNLIVYLNPEWQKNWGGNIELHKNPHLNPIDDEITSVLPIFNRAIIFETTGVSWHGFPRINLPKDKCHISRKSFALYYYSKAPSENSKTHSTIYVERHLPQKFKAGMQLSQNDLDEITLLLSRRDQHIKRLYRYNTHLSNKTVKLKYKIKRMIYFFTKHIKKSSST